MNDQLAARIAQFSPIDAEQAALLAEIQSDDWETAREAADALAAYGRDALVGLLPLLKSPSILTRRATALALRDIGAAFAVPFLVAAIEDPLTWETHGSMAYALRYHDCATLFLFLFNLALNGTFEAQNHALSILYDQTFFFSDADLDTTQRQLNQYASRTDRDPDTDLLIDDLQGLLDDLRGIADEQRDEQEKG
jgi:HEAT repeat protein